MLETKHSKLMKEIVCKFHPEFVKSSDLRDYGTKYPEIFNIERLVEESLAATGGYNFVDEAGRDFDDTDNSDSKTTTVVNNDKEGSRKVFIVSNVQTKIGSLRITCFNPFSDKVDFFYVPSDQRAVLQENDGSKYREQTGHCKRIRTAWSEKTDYYNKLENFRVGDFVTLATSKDKQNIDTHHE